ncbi:outer membrane beta-barrel protein [Thalassotalea hakodatensis]|uniref:outer membrane beta-barrel protein n=1 Tax=Thalassotalea hakodatensis TaxID=3030492 RepID=UPI00257466DC|nr:outer membrane beta-barrel protein [Thalassotalea hakodatensis]
MKKITLASLFSLCAFTASAEWSGGVGYANLSNEDISLGALVGEVAYNVHKEEKFSLITGLRYGIGIQDDSASYANTTIDIELDRFVAIDVKVQFALNEQVYAYLLPSYGNAKLSASVVGESASDDDWEFGYGGGIGYQFNQQSAIEASYQQFDDTDVLGVSYTFKF